MRFFLEFLKSLPGTFRAYTAVNSFITAVLRTGPIPRHVAFIMDGNRRFAKNHRMEVEKGHSAGAQTLINIMQTCFSLGIREVSVYAFSIENFNRSQEEVDKIFNLLRDSLRSLTNEESSELGHIRVRVIGNRSMIPSDILGDLDNIEKNTESYDDAILNICAPYTSRDEITHALKQITKEAPSTVTAKDVSDHFYYGDISSHVDILVRTSGHSRLSDYLLWQCNEHTSIYFVDTLWPDFGKTELIRILFNWSFNRFLRLCDLELNKVSKDVDLKAMPEAPPLVTVTKRN